MKNSQEVNKLRRLGEKEIYKYLGTLEGITIEEVEIKEKRKSISGEPENYLRQNYVVETLSKG